MRPKRAIIAESKKLNSILFNTLECSARANGLESSPRHSKTNTNGQQEPDSIRLTRTFESLAAALKIQPRKIALAICGMTFN